MQWLSRCHQKTLNENILIIRPNTLIATSFRGFILLCFCGERLFLCKKNVFVQNISVLFSL